MGQLSQSGRQVYLVAVSQGRVFYALPGDAAWTESTNTTGNSPPLSFTGTVFSAANNQKLYFADGSNWALFNPSLGTTERWSASKGVLPVDSMNNTPRLTETWRGRTVLAGLLGDPQNVFFSAVGDPTDFDYFPSDPTPAQAAALNTGPQGLVGDAVTGFCPYTDDVGIIFGDHSVFLMAGDPADGGRIDRVSDVIGGTFGICWAKDPYGSVYFMSNRMGVYSLVPGQRPQRISQNIDQLIADVDTGANSIRLVWDDRYQGLHVFVTPLAAPASATHLFWEARTGGWWKQRFANNDHNPLACCVFDGNLPGDRAAVIGSWDGYVRSFSPAAADDDGTPISWEVWVGPLVTKDLDELLLRDLQGVMGESSANVNYAVYSAKTAEAALVASPVRTGTWGPGRSLNAPIRSAAHAHYVKLSGLGRAMMEQVRAQVGGRGMVRRRGQV